jgi:hypothetical protein
MAARGRTNTAAKSTKKTTAVKKTAVSTPKPTAKAKTTGKVKTGFIDKAIGVATQVIGGSSAKSSSGTGGTHRATAKNLLKRAYERKAKRFIRMGMLGQARRTLRKKVTVV